VINFAGNVTSGWVDVDTFGMGASTAVFGFIGAILGNILKQAHGMRAEMFWTASIPIAYFTITDLVNEFVNQSTESDNTAHIAGWFNGMFYIMIFLPTLNQVGAWRSKLYSEVMWWGSLGIVVVANLAQLIYYFTLDPTNYDN
jgi:membrane associated rhomboid family serine protease